MILIAQSWHLNPLPGHPNGMRFTVFNKSGDMLATNEYFSVGGGFVVNEDTQTAENMYYMETDAESASPSRRSLDHGVHPLPSAPLKAIAGPSSEADETPSGQPPYLFTTAGELLQICVEHDLTIAQVIWENERAFRSDEDIRQGLFNRKCYRDSRSLRRSLGRDGRVYS